MEFLHKLWDETLAGPTPDSGLPELRKYNSFSAMSTAPPAVVAPPHDDSRLTPVPSNYAHRNLSVVVGSASAPPSPSAYGTPSSPFSPNTPGGNLKKLTRRKSTSGALHNSESSKSPTGYDWIVLSALDR